MRSLRVSPVVFTTVIALVAASCADADAPTPLSPESAEASLQGGGPAPASDQHVAHMHGGEEVPAVQTLARGQTTFRVSADGSEVSYRLIVANLMNVTQAHIHLGPFGANGPVVVWLYPGGPPPQLIPGRSSGVLATGVFTADDLVGPLAGQPLSALLDALESGNAYVNVHTSQFPPGEIRGQIR